MIKLCMVAHFDSPHYFQWYVALERCASKLGYEISSINASPAHRKVYNDFDANPHWQPLREADLVFVYCTRRSSRCEPSGISWWALPMFVKPFMKPTAKMIAQYDDEFVWLFDPKHVWWNINIMPNPDNKGPEEFFKRTGILEIPDAHLVVRGNPMPEFTKYTTKPVFKLPLPHLFRYTPSKYSEEHNGKNIGILLHSILEASIHNTLENVIRPNNWSVSIFSGTLDNKRLAEFRQNEMLPVNSETYPRVDYEPYMDLLWRYCSIGLDDNSNYFGWSRFAMECAIANIPCVGSTEAVQDIFPELYTAPRDYAKQIELINRLKTDKIFYLEMQRNGRKRIFELLDDEKLCRAMLDIFNKITPSKSQLTFQSFPFLYNQNYNPDKQQARPHP
jgi:hypothetical protein